MGSAPSFDEIVLPNLDAAYRLARWLVRDAHDAEDVVQEASLRALRYFDTFTGGNGRAWFLRIVRNTCWSWRGHGSERPTEPFDEEQHSVSRSPADPETLALRSDDVRMIERALRNVPGRLRELLVLRELEGLSYRELADVLGIPIGTVMSGLSRARQAARRAIDEELKLRVSSLSSLSETRNIRGRPTISDSEGASASRRGSHSSNKEVVHVIDR